MQVGLSSIDSILYLKVTWNYLKMFCFILDGKRYRESVLYVSIVQTHQNRTHKIMHHIFKTWCIVSTSGRYAIWFDVEIWTWLSRNSDSTPIFCCITNGFWIITIFTQLDTLQLLFKNVNFNSKNKMIWTLTFLIISPIPLILQAFFCTVRSFKPIISVRAIAVVKQNEFV